MALADVLGAAELAAIAQAGELRFHAVGDTGGWGNPIPQRAVTAAMATELAGGASSPRANFLYHLGDVVYPHGASTGYPTQFVAGYRDYSAPILGVPGNHDGEGDGLGGPSTSEPPLAAFAAQFCAPAGSAGGQSRPAQHQPHVYWTLEHEWLTVIGLYTGVPEGGQLDREQLAWLTGELANARPGTTLLLAMHHPVYSADVQHGSNLELGDALDECFRRARRFPDAVLSAHAHNYQRFSRAAGGRTIPYVVAGSGGYPELHRLGYGVPDPPASFAGLPGVTLEAHQHRAFGFLTVIATPGAARIDYSIVVRRRPALHDSVAITAAPKR